MKMRTPAGLLASAALVAATALPAYAAVTSIIVPAGIGPAAVDTTTKLVYVGTTPTQPAGPGEAWTSSAGVAKVDPSTKKVVKSITISYLLDTRRVQSVSDVKVSSSSNDLWILVGGIDVANGCWSKLHQLDKSTLATIRRYNLGCSKKIELDPTSRWAYLTEAPLYDDRGQNAQPLTKATVVAINGATGSRHSGQCPVADIGRDFLSRPSRADLDYLQPQELRDLRRRPEHGLGIYNEIEPRAYNHPQLPSPIGSVHGGKLDHKPDLRYRQQKGDRDLRSHWQYHPHINSRRRLDHGDRYELEHPLSGYEYHQSVDPEIDRKADLQGPVRGFVHPCPLLGDDFAAVYNPIGL